MLFYFVGRNFCPYFENVIFSWISPNMLLKFPSLFIYCFYLKREYKLCLFVKMCLENCF